MLPEDDSIQALFQELNQYAEQGVYMEIEGEPASPTQIVKAHILKEDSGYMRDYIMNDKGYLKELYFHQINKKNK